MSISVGGINLPEGIIDAQYRIAVLEKIVEHLINRIAPGTLTAVDLERFQREALADMQRKYPEAGIVKK
jgi:hypothetical protein